MVAGQRHWRANVPRQCPADGAWKVTRLRLAGGAANLAVWECVRCRKKDADGAAWQPVDLTTTDYTDAQHYTITEQEWDGSAWVNTERFAQDGSDRTVESWDGAQWVFERKQTLTYDGSNRLVDLTETTWDGSQWVNDYRAVYVFDASSGLRTEFRLDTWDGSDWANDHKQEYSFDSNGNQTEDLILEWTGTEWANLQRTTTTWQEVGGVGIDDGRAFADGYRLLQNYPNPVVANTTIRFELPLAADVSLTAFDLLGRQVMVFFSGSLPAGLHEFDVDVRDLSTGTYFYRLASGSTAVTRRMIVTN
jgi:hypothetical protein